MFFAIFLIGIFSDIAKVQLLLPVLATIQFQKVLMVLAVAGALKDPASLARIAAAFSSKHGRALLFLLLWMILSVPFSVWPGISFAFLGENFWKTLLGFLMVIAYGSTESALEKMIWAFILAVSLFGAATALFPTNERLAEIQAQAYDRNELGFLFVLALPFVFWKIKQYEGIKKRSLQVLFVLLVTAIVATQSRGAFLGLLAVISFIGFQLEASVMKKIGSLLIIVLVIGAIATIFGQEKYFDRIASIADTEKNYNYSAEAGRVAVWERGLGLIEENPFLGVGVNAFTSAEGRTHKDGKWSAAHNSLLQVGAELGIPGLLAYCIMVWSLIRNSRWIALSLGRETSFYLCTGAAVSGSLAGYLVNGFFLSMAYSNVVFLLFGFAFSFINIAHFKKRQDGDLAPLLKTRATPHPAWYMQASASHVIWALPVWKYGSLIAASCCFIHGLQDLC